MSLTPVPPIRPITQIVPFTYRAGLTYLEVLEEFRKYINKYLVPEFNETVNRLNENFAQYLNDLIQQGEQNKQELINDYNEFTELINTTVNNFITQQTENYDEFTDTINNSFNDFTANLTTTVNNFITQQTDNYNDFIDEQTNNYNNFVNTQTNNYNNFTNNIEQIVNEIESGSLPYFEIEIDAPDTPIDVPNGVSGMFVTALKRTDITGTPLYSADFISAPVFNVALDEILTVLWIDYGEGEYRGTILDALGNLDAPRRLLLTQNETITLNENQLIYRLSPIKYIVEQDSVGGHELTVNVGIGSGVALYSNSTHLNAEPNSVTYLMFSPVDTRENAANTDYYTLTSKIVGGSGGGVSQQDFDDFVTATGNNFTTTNGNVTALTGRVTVNENDIDDLKSRATDIEGDVTTINTNITNLTTTVNGKVDSVNGKTGAATINLFEVMQQSPHTFIPMTVGTFADSGYQTVYSDAHIVMQKNDLAGNVATNAIDTSGCNGSWSDGVDGGTWSFRWEHIPVPIAPAPDTGTFTLKCENGVIQWG